MGSGTSNERQIRKGTIGDNPVDCKVVLSGRLFYNTGIPACPCFVPGDRYSNKFRSRKNQAIFVGARKLANMIGRRHKQLAGTVIKKPQTHAIYGTGKN